MLYVNAKKNGGLGGKTSNERNIIDVSSIVCLWFWVLQWAG